MSGRSTFSAVTKAEIWPRGPIALNVDEAAVVAAEAQYAALGGTAAADLQSLQSQVDTLRAQISAAESAVRSADAALASQQPASQADVQAAQTAVVQAQASLDAAQAALAQANNPRQASIAVTLIEFCRSV